jgi:hypothetical protein
VPSCSAEVYNGTVGVVRSTGVSSSIGVVAMETIGITTLHPRGSREPELPPLSKPVSLSSGESSRTVCRHGDPRCTIHTNTAPESHPLGERLSLQKWSAVNSKLPKHMVSPGASPMPVRLLPLATTVSLDE